MNESLFSLQKLTDHNPYPTIEVEVILSLLPQQDYAQFGSELGSRCASAARNSDSMNLLFWSRTLHLFGKQDTTNYYVQCLGYYYAAYNQYIQRDFKRAIEYTRTALDIILKAQNSTQNASLIAEIHIMAAYSYAQCDETAGLIAHLDAAERVFTTLGNQDRLTGIAAYRKSLSTKKPSVLSVEEVSQKLADLQVEIETQTAQLKLLQARNAILRAYV